MIGCMSSDEELAQDLAEESGCLSSIVIVGAVAAALVATLLRRFMAAM